MAKFVNINETRPKYDFLNQACIGRRCFHGVICEGGSAKCSNRKHQLAAQMRKANAIAAGCPDPLPAYDKMTAARNKAQGWRLSK